MPSHIRKRKEVWSRTVFHIEGQSPFMAVKIRLVGPDQHLEKLKQEKDIWHGSGRASRYLGFGYMWGCIRGHSIQPCGS